MVLQIGLGSLQKNYNIYSQLVNYLYETGLFDDIVKAFETKSALQLDPALDEALYFLGLTYLRKGDDSAAYLCFIKYKKIPSYNLRSHQKRRGWKNKSPKARRFN